MNNINNYCPTSGGPIYRITKELKAEVLATIVSNAKTETGASYPYVNMAVPTRAFIRLVQHFILDRGMYKGNCMV